MADIVKRIEEAFRHDTFWDTDAPPLLSDAVAEIKQLREAIRRLAEQDATLSVCDGDVTVTMDATLTDEEREAIEAADAYMSAAGCRNTNVQDTLRGLLERKNHDAVPEARVQQSTREPERSLLAQSESVERGLPRTGNTLTLTDAEREAMRFCSGSRGGQINRSPERQSPDRERGERSLRDVPQQDNCRAAGGPEQNTQEPVAWAVVYPNDEVAIIAFKRRDADERASASDRVVPLYRSPTLTDEEREAVEWYAGYGRDGLHADTLRKLLDRLHT